jgi:two-component system, LytTR family, sensor kinase
MYVIVPSFLYRRKIALFLLSYTGLLIANFFLACLAGILYIHMVSGVSYDQIDFNQNRYNTFVNGIWIPFIVLSLCCGIQLTKKWMLQHSINESLVRENVSKELKHLKTRIHPRFLFHSLNALEGKLRSGVPESPDLILKMSELLNYVLFGSEGDYVLLKKELEVIREYIDLQKANYHEKIQINLIINDENEDAFLAPLILLPFLETSFEYLMVMDATAKHMDVKILTSDGILFFYLTCTEYYPSEARFYHQPVWSDITKRIENLYPDNHQLILKSGDNEIMIELRLNMIHAEKQLDISNETLNKDHEYA